MNKILFLGILSFSSFAFISCTQKQESKGVSEHTVDEQERIEALAMQKADSMMRLEQEKQRLEAEERERQAEKDRQLEQEKARAEEERRIEEKNIENLLDGYWSEYSDIQEANVTDGFEPFQPAMKFEVYSHKLKDVRLYLSKVTTEFTYTFRYENGNVYVTRSGYFTDALWYSFDKDRMELRKKNGTILRKIR